MNDINNQDCAGSCGNKSSRVAVAIVGMVLLAGVITVAILRDRIVNHQYRSVTITGQGRVAYVPDIAAVTLGVQIDKVARPEEALNQLNAKMDGIIKAIKALGISEDNIQTRNYSLYPQYDYKDNISVVSGYNANQQLVVKVSGYDKDPNRLNAVIAAASKAGANQINSLDFDASNMNDLKQQARIAAINDAAAKSGSLAAAAGVKLGDITGWYENLINPTPDYYASAEYGKGGASSSVSSPNAVAGSREVIMEISLTYDIR